MSSVRYYDTTVLSFAQMEQAVRTSAGKVIKTRKLDLRKQVGLEPGRETILAATLRAFAGGEDLLAIFKPDPGAGGIVRSWPMSVRRRTLDA